MRTALVSAVLVLACAKSGGGRPAAPDAGPLDETYFEAGSFGQFDDIFIPLFSPTLRAMQQPSLRPSSNSADKEAYRLLWMGSKEFKRLTVQIEVEPNDTDVLTLREGSTVSTTSLSKETVRDLRDALIAADFWRAPGTDMSRGYDGHEWVFEGLRSGTHHSVERWSPREGPWFDLGSLFLALAKKATPSIASPKP